ncbi:MAG: gamma-glutamyltransferase [Pseudomonadales bacterium]
MNRIILVTLFGLVWVGTAAAQTSKPLLHGQHWMAITGKPLAATAGARIFEQGGNAVDAACAMLAATSTMWDVLGWGGETQALIYHPGERRVIGINALGVAPSGATAEFFRDQGMEVPPEYGPLAAVTPGTPGGLMVMLAEYGRLSLAEVLAPAIRLAEGYPIEAQAANSIEAMKAEIKKWPPSRKVFLVHEGQEREAPHPGEIFRQPDLKATLEKLVAAEQEALAAGATRKDAIYAAYERFYRGDIAEAFVAGSQALGGLHTRDDLANWEVKIEAPRSTTYKGIDVYKLDVWTQGPAMLQALNMAELVDLKAMGYNSARYVHTLYQIISMAFADRDFYYGDPYLPPEEPVAGLLSKRYAEDRLKTLDPERNDPLIKPGDPYRFQLGNNPFREYLDAWTNAADEGAGIMPPWQQASIDPTAHDPAAHDAAFLAGTTSIQAADADGWVISVTPSGGWIPAAIAGDTGIGMSQRMQSFVTDPAQNPYNVVAPGKRPRVTLTPTLAFKEGKPWLAFSVQGGDAQDQNLLQFFLNVVEFGMDVQQAAEAPNFWSFQLRNSFGDHRAQPGRILLNEAIPAWVRQTLVDMGYRPEYRARTSGPITAIEIDSVRGTFRGAASDFGEDYGIAW